jgi:cytidylate kinase
LKERLIIAIDGPPGAGKTSVSKLLARRMKWKLIDTGAMYRAAACVAMEKGLGLDEEQALTELLSGLSIDFAMADNSQRIVVNGEDLEDRIRGEEMGRYASRVSRLSEVRRVLVRKQMEMGKAGEVVCEGRDATTVIFPHAKFRYFLDAQACVRALRRYLETEVMEMHGSFKDVYDEMIRRDIEDSTREHSPLRLAEGVRFLDTTGKSIEDVVDEILVQVRGEG